MLNLSILPPLRSDEQIHELVRRHPLSMGLGLIIAGAFMILPFYLLPIFSAWHGVGWISFSILLLIGAVLAFRAFCAWSASVVVLTSHRICQVEQRGFWKRSVIDTPLAFIDVVQTTHEGISDAILRTGSLFLHLTGGEGPIELSKLPSPERLQSLIQELREKRGWQKEISESVDVVDPSNSLAKRVAILLNNADEKILKEVEQILTKKNEE